MSFDVFFNFAGDCREAVAFYAKVFGQEVQNLMTYADAPPDPDYTTPEKDKNLIMYACVPIFGCNAMFMDMPSGTPLIKGNNISPTISTKDEEEIKRLFHALSEGGEIGMELQKTFWSDLYGMVTDQFGITWQLMHDSGKY